MSLLTATGFKKLKRSNMLLNRKHGGAFDIQNNNGFIRSHGLKDEVPSLNKKQKELLSQKIRSYALATNKRLVITMAITLTTSAGLMLLARQAITLL